MKICQVDITRFAIDGFTLGEVMPSTAAQHDGIETGLEGDRLNSIFVTLDKFTGHILTDGAAVEFSTSTTPKETEDLLGQPYWRGADDDELILFYEYHFGDVEVQFEFPDSANLGFTTIAKNGVLSDPDQRSSYGVDKPWPPTNK